MPRLSQSRLSLLLFSIPLLLQHHCSLWSIFAISTTCSYMPFGRAKTPSANFFRGPLLHHRIHRPQLQPQTISNRPEISCCCPNRAEWQEARRAQLCFISTTWVYAPDKIRFVTESFCRLY